MDVAVIRQDQEGHFMYVVSVRNANLRLTGSANAAICGEDEAE